MRRGPDVSNDFPSSTQNRRRHRQSQREIGSDDEDQGDAMNWDWLGRIACLPKNARPSVTGFLLGPLSVQKRTRQVVQRINREAPDATQAVQPRTLEQEDLDQREDSNLTEMCTKINKLLWEWQRQAEKAAEEEINQLEDCTEEMAWAIADKHGIADDGGVPLFRFCINSKSFGQSVENLFYVSFLVRDGTVGLAVDRRGLPSLRKSIIHQTSFLVQPWSVYDILTVEQIPRSHTRPVWHRKGASRSTKLCSVLISTLGRI